MYFSKTKIKDDAIRRINSDHNFNNKPYLDTCYHSACYYGLQDMYTRTRTTTTCIDTGKATKYKTVSESTGTKTDATIPTTKNTTPSESGRGKGKGNKKGEKENVQERRRRSKQNESTSSKASESSTTYSSSSLPITLSTPIGEKDDNSSDEGDDDDDSEYEMLVSNEQLLTMVIQNMMMAKQTPSPPPPPHPLPVPLSEPTTSSTGRSSNKKRERTENKELLEPPFRPSNWEELYELACLSTDHMMFKDCQCLPDLMPALKEINSMIGLTEIKNKLADHIMYHCQKSKLLDGKRPKIEGEDGDMNHMVIMGPPGCGKTTIASAIAHLYCLMGQLATKNVVHATREKMIGEHIGSTAPKTQKLIDSALGGVLLIDEAYSLGDGRRSSGGGDIFSKECIDTLNDNLSKKGDQFTCIVIGYPEALRRDFFSVNPGLHRRFPMTHKIENYTAIELQSIFTKMCKDRNVLCDISKFPTFFTKNHAKFTQNASTVHMFVRVLKEMATKRCFGSDDLKLLQTTGKDLTAGMAVIQKTAETLTGISTSNKSEDFMSMYN